MSTLTLNGRPSVQSLSIAALLSFLWPGLGQWYLQRRRAAVVYGLPTLVVLLPLVIRAVAGFESFAVTLIDPSVALTLLVLIGLVGLWRILSIVDAVAAHGGRPALRTRAGVVVLALTAMVIITHGVAGYFAWAAYDAGSKIFVGGPRPDVTAPSPDPSVAPTDDYLATPFATPPTTVSRITLLLTGIDSATGRSHALTDTLLIVSVDPVTADVAMVSFPRDIAQFPLSDGRIFTGKINSLMTYARNHPKEFPDGPFPTLVKELSFLLGTPIHYYAAVDLDGFRRMIDVVGGVTVDNPRRISDPKYGWLDGGTGSSCRRVPRRSTGARRWRSSARAMARETTTSRGQGGSSSSFRPSGGR